jgi:hypothetical protein
LDVLEIELRRRPSCFDFGEVLRSKLNRADQATDAKLAASKTALGLHFILIFQRIFLLTTGTCCESIHIKAYFVTCEDHVIKIQ